MESYVRDTYIVSTLTCKKTARVVRNKVHNEIELRVSDIG